MALTQRLPAPLARPASAARHPVRKATAWQLDRHLPWVVIVLFASIAAWAYALALAAGMVVAPWHVELPPRSAFLVDLGVLAGFALHFHVVQRKALVSARAPLGFDRPLAALASGGLLCLLVASLWQPLPQAVWAVATPGVAGLLWSGYALGWLLLLRAARRPGYIVAGLLMVEWCTPVMSLGHLVFALVLCTFGIAYRRPLALLAGPRRHGLPPRTAGVAS